MANKISFVIQLKDKFGRVAQKVNRQFRNMTVAAKKANRAVSDFAKKAQASMGEFGRKAAKTGAVMTASLTVPIGLLVKNMISAASAAEEVNSKFAQVFRGMDKEGAVAVKGLVKDFKLATSTAKTMLSTTGAILSSSGLSKDRILEISKALNAASIDLSSFHDYQGTATESSLILTKALLGEAETLKTNFGIQITMGDKAFNKQVKLKQRLLGLNVKAAKAEVIFAEIMRQAGKDGQKALGDFKRTADGYANTARTNAEATKAMSEAFGVLLLPVATKLTRLMTALSTSIAALSDPVKNIIIVLAGLVAIGGPLLLLVGGLAIAFAAMSAPVLVMGAAIMGLVAAGALLYLNWEGVVGGLKSIWIDFSGFIVSTAASIGGVFNNMWDSAKSGFISLINFYISNLNTLLAPLNFVSEKLGMGTLNINSIAAPSAPNQAISGSLDGQITVAAEQGTKVKSTRMRTRGRGMHVGMNMAAQ